MGMSRAREQEVKYNLCFPYKCTMREVATGAFMNIFDLMTSLNSMEVPKEAKREMPYRGSAFDQTIS